MPWKNVPWFTNLDNKQYLIWSSIVQTGQILRFIIIPHFPLQIPTSLAFELQNIFSCWISGSIVTLSKKKLSLPVSLIFSLSSTRTFFWLIFLHHCKIFPFMYSSPTTTIPLIHHYSTLLHKNWNFIKHF